MEGYPSKFLKNGVVDIHYVEAGPADGPLVVLLHGFPASCYLWTHQLGPLADAGFHVVAPDMRGYNLSSKPEGISAYAHGPVLSDVTALLRHCNSCDGAKPTLVGHDWGGIVAWRYAQEHPEDLGKLVVLNTAHPLEFGRALTTDLTQMQKSWYIYMFQQPNIGENVFRANDFGFLRIMMKATFARPQEDDVIEKFVEPLKREGALTGGINYYRNLLTNWGLFEEKKVELPVLSLWGDRELYFESYLSEPSRELVPNIQVEHFPESTHWIMWDEPEKVNEKLLQFLKGA